MTSHRDQRRRLAVAGGVALFAVSALAACGRQGPLERPAPLFGERARAQYEAERAQEARDDAQRQAQTRGEAGPTGPDNAPATSRELRDPNQRLDPASSNPIPGAPNPFGSAAPPTGR
jgi:predicted small lipoprotein YifL